MDENEKNDTPSTSSDVMPTGGGSIGQAAKQKVKNTAKKGFDALKEATGRGIKALWAILPLQVKIVVVVIIIVLIVILAAMLMGMIEESTSVTNDTVDSYISSAEDLKDSDGKSLYDEKSSLIKLKISDINKMYDKFVSDDKGGTETQTLMQYKIGSNDVSADNRIVSIDDKLPVYKHIMMTEKYNFNSVKWQKFSHSSTAGKKVDNFKEDKDLGLKYPDDSKNESGGDNPNPTKLEKFIDLTLPYLQTWYIPLAMSNASIINGKETDSNRAPAFSYNIIKEAYSNIVVNWYELKKHTLVTQYHVYDKIEKHDTLYNVVVTESQRKVFSGGSDTNFNYETTGYSVNSGNISSVTSNDKVEHIDTSTTNGFQGGTKDPMKEDLLSQKDEYTSTYYLKEADVFDAKIINDFNYQVYMDSDAQKRINADSTNESSATWTKTADNIENRYDKSSVSCDSKGNLQFSNGRGTSKVYGGDNAVTTDYPDLTRRITRTYTVDLGKYYEYENGKEVTVTRIWKDKLSQTASKTSDYTIDDLILYNQSDDRKEKVSGTDLCGESYSSSASSGTSTGTSAPATEIKVESYTYPVFNQGSYPRTTSHGGDTIAQAGCGLCSLTTVVGGITGKKVDPVSCGNDTNWSGPKTLAQIGTDLKSVYNIDTEVTRWNNKNDGSAMSEKQQISKTKISNALKNNNPVIALVKPNEAVLGTSAGGAHYITLVELSGDNVIIANSAGGKREEYNLDFVIQNIYIGANTTECGFVIAKRSGSSSSSSTSSTTASTSTNTSSTPKGNGQGKVTSTSNVNSTGYTGIFTSGTTGRSFKEYKQNGNTFVGKYDISSVKCSWSSECGTVSTIIVGSGYTNKSNFADVTSKLKSNGGGTDFSSWLSDYAKDAEVKKIDSPSQSKLKNLLSDGCVAVVHDPGYSEAGHYMAILDINKDKTQIYVSNPDSNNNIQDGWNPISVFYTGGQYLTDCYFVSNKGSVAEYSGNDTDSSVSDTVCTGTSSGKYYTNLKNTDGLNRIDFMNSNPDIMHRYIREGAEYLEYVGYSRSKLALSYWNLKKLLQQVYEKNDSLPWAYGKTLGFENIYSSTGSSNSKVNGAGIFTWPVPEYVEAGIKMQDQLTAHFAGNDSVHNGNHGAIDIQHSTNKAATIVAAAAGTVIVSEDSTVGSTYPNGPQTYGNYVVIDHGNGYFTLYGHMQHNSIVVKTGDKVNKGQKIGIMGTTGYSTGPHLHFEVRKGENFNTAEKVDPEQFFNDDCSSVGGVGNGEFLITSGYKADSNYKGQTYSLTSEQRTFLEHVVTGEFGTSYEGSVLIAQCMRDAFVKGLCDDPMKVRLSNANGGLGYVGWNDNICENAKNAIKYVFDEGGSGVQHRVLVMCTKEYSDANPGNWHATQNFILQFENVLFYDYWN